MGKIDNRIQRRKKKRLDKLYLGLLEKGEMTNHQLRRIVRVSSATITRYMDELEKQGRVEQISSKRYTKYKAVVKNKINQPMA